MIGTIGRWWGTPVPLARVAVFRTLIYGFVIFDVLLVANDVIPHGLVPAFYRPTMIPRLLHVPPLGVTGAWVLLIVLIAACVLAMSGKLQRLAGWTVAIGFWLWMFNAQGFSYVSHDHLALMVAVAVLPTVGVIRRDERGELSVAAGWALRCVQLCVILTYFASAIVKWILSGSPQAWANGDVFVWAITRRGSGLIRWTLEVPALLRVGQWGLLAIEFLSPVVLFLRGKWLYAAVIGFCLFHFTTYLALGIHFLPTVVCWAAFLPLERFGPWLRRMAARLRGPRIRR